MKRSLRIKRLSKTFFLMAAVVLIACRASSAAGPKLTALQLSSSTKPEELVSQGAAALQAGQTKLAIQDYNAALAAAPQDPAKRGMIEFGLGIAYGRAQ